MGSWLAKALERRVNKAKVLGRCGVGNEFGARVWIDEHCTIGSYNYFGADTFVTKAVIGNFCSIGNNVVIGPGEHDPGRISTSAKFMSQPAYDTLTAKDITIGSDVWIGTQAIVLRGIHVHTGAVIAANAVVTHDVPPYAIVAGVPAKVLRLRFEPNVIERILASNWFEMDLAKARDIIDELQGLVRVQGEG